MTVRTTTTIEANGSGTLTAAVLRVVLEEFPDDAAVHVRHEDSQRDGASWNVRATITGESAHQPRPEAFTCLEHKPRQHRDGKEPWCDSCRLTSDGREPMRLGGARYGRQG